MPLYLAVHLLAMMVPRFGDTVLVRYALKLRLIVSSFFSNPESSYLKLPLMVGDCIFLLQKVPHGRTLTVENFRRLEYISIRLLLAKRIISSF